MYIFLYSLCRIFTIFQCETPTPYTPPCCLKVMSHGQKNIIKFYIFNLQWPYGVDGKLRTSDPLVHIPAFPGMRATPGTPHQAPPALAQLEWGWQR